MAYNKFCWISASESCNIWDKNFELIHKFDEGDVLDVSCSQDGSTLAFLRKANSQIFTASIGSNICHNPTTIAEGNATAVGFSNELLLVGTSLGNVLLWDYTKHKLMRKYDGNDRSAVSRIQSNISLIAAGHYDGIIQVYGIKTGQAMGQYSITNSSGLRDLKISPVKNSLLAAAFNSGSVAAWNTNSNKINSSLVAEFINAHQSPATSVALSPVTDILMVSGGLDKNVILYDCPKKKILKKIEIDSPVTSVEFFPDGTSLVVGTNRGKILLYDLRSISTPVQSVTAHSKAINKLICCPFAYSQNKTEPMLPKKTIKYSTSSVTEVANEFTEKPRVSQPSPMRNDVDFQTVSSPSVTATSNSITDFPPSAHSYVNKDLEHKNSSLFSPLKGENSADIFSSPSLATSPLLKFKMKEYKENQEIPMLRNETLLSSGEDESKVAGSSSNTQLTPPSQIIPTVQESAQQKNVAQGETSVDFQAEFIRRIVQDVEDNLREVLRCRFGDLIIQSAQQFLTLQNELAQLRQQIEEKAYLEEEVKQLRSEVNRLRNLY